MSGRASVEFTDCCKNREAKFTTAFEKLLQTTESNARWLDTEFAAFEVTAKQMAAYLGETTDPARLKDRSYMNGILEDRIRPLTLSALRSTDNAKAAYAYTNAELFGAMYSSYYYFNGAGKPENYELANEVTPDDELEYYVAAKRASLNAEWYFLPVVDGVSSWQKPQHYAEMDEFVVSYTIPIESEQTSASGEQVAAAAEQQLSSMEELSAHAERLRALSGELSVAIGRFRTE